MDLLRCALSLCVSLPNPLTLYGMRIYPLLVLIHSKVAEDYSAVATGSLQGCAQVRTLSRYRFIVDEAIILHSSAIHPHPRRFTIVRFIKLTPFSPKDV